MRKIITLLFVFATSYSIAQNVGINADGTDPHPSAMLDVKSSDKGILIPRVALTGFNDATTIPSPQTSLLVYNTATVGSGITALTPGFYYWNGSAWTSILTSLNVAANTWTLGGNSGTNPGSHFIGTTDNQPLVFKINNQPIGKLSQDNLSFGFNALNNATGNANIAIGIQSQFKSINGRENVAIGAGTLFENQSGQYNVAIGNASLNKNISSGNTSLGSASLLNNTTGYQNIAIGYNAATNNTTGANNTIVGSNANSLNNNINNSTALGAFSRVDCDNCLVLGSVNGVNGASSNIRAGIGTTNPNASALLELNSTDKGFLIPRMSSAQRLAIASPAVGLLVFQTDVNPGFYFYNSSGWVPFLTSNTGWSTIGNTGTDPNYNFIGTTDNKPLLFKVNNQLAGKLDFSSNQFSITNVAFGANGLVANTTGGQNTALGAFTLEKNTTSWYNTAVGSSALRNSTGAQNTAVGANALFGNTTGFFNAAVGDGALASNSTGYANTAIGSGAMNSNSTGAQNTSIGGYTMQNSTTGSSNTANGYYSLNKNITGSGNTGTGLQALFNNTIGNSNVATGLAALSNNTTGSSNVAIGTGTMNSNQTGSNNTAVGTSANVAVDGLSNATAIGSNATVACSNCLVLGDNSTKVGIGTSSISTSAALEITSSDKGVLIPRLTQAQRNAIPSPAIGLLIYQTDNTPGVYNFDGTTWTPLTPIITPGWTLNGNSGTNSGQFVGTTDNQPLNFKINNQFAGRIAARNISFGVNALTFATGNDNIAIGQLSLFNNSTGNGNTATGSETLRSNTSGFNNTALGFQAMYHNESGSFNTALGSVALPANQGSFNTAVGSNTLENNTTGANNTAQGMWALSNNTTGSKNSALGVQANVGVGNLTNATAIGANALVNCDNCLVLGSVNSVNGATSDVKVGIGTINPNPSAALDVNSNNKGLLIPRMTEAQRNVIISPANGLLIYQIDNTPGLYSYNGTAWVPVTPTIPTITPSWSLNGNAGIDPNTQFIGTTDNQPLVFKVNNIKAGNMDVGSSSTYFGLQAGLNASGLANTAFGMNALINTTNMPGNTAVGAAALWSNTTGYDNTAIGRDANVQSGNLHNATALGSRSLAGCNDCLVLGSVEGVNQASNSVRVGVGTVNPHTSAALEVNSTNKGILIPRMTQTQRNAITTPQNGLLIYQTDNTPGLYNFNGAAWIPVTPTIAPSWSLTGNVGIDPNTQFIGTTDNQPVLFKMANQKAGRLDLLNSAYGVQSLAANVNGFSNTAIGRYALYSNTEGNTNTGIGEGAMNDNTTGNGNTSIGAISLRYNTTGHNNTAIGKFSLLNNTSGSQNTAIGNNANVGSAGLNNATAIGANAQVDCNNCLVLGSTNGVNGANTNVKVGIGTTNPNSSAILEINSTDKGILVPRMTQSQRDFITSPATGLLIYQTDNIPGFYYYNGSTWTSFTNNINTSNLWSTNGNAGTNNSINFIGTTDNQALVFKTNNAQAGIIHPSGDITSFGLNALSLSSSGMYNTAIGNSALGSNISGENNTSIGALSLRSNINGNGNTAIGSQNLVMNTSGSYNIAMGIGALYSNTNGTHNIGSGYNALGRNTEGQSNIGIGYFALANNTTGSTNIAIGNNTLTNNTIGTLNTAIGSTANVSSNNLSNATAIGYGAIVDGSNKIRLGNSAVTVIEGQVPFTTPSDGRYKFNIKENVRGLDFILRLRPVTYQFDVKRFDGNRTSNMIPAAYDEATSIRRTGFIAQEVDKAANESNYDFSGIIRPKTTNDHFSLSYESFVVPLVKAIQEQQEEIKDQQKQIEDLKKENSELRKLKAQFDELTKKVESISNNK